MRQWRNAMRRNASVWPRETRCDAGNPLRRPSAVRNLGPKAGEQRAFDLIKHGRKVSDGVDDIMRARTLQLAMSGLQADALIGNGQGVKLRRREANRVARFCDAYRPHAGVEAGFNSHGRVV